MTQSLPLMRLAPEQMSAQINRSLGFIPGYTDDTGTFHSALTDSYVVGLGGVDFDGAFRRDPVAKVTTLLIARHLAWTTASQAVNDDVAGKHNPTLFSKCNVRKDRPYQPSDDAKSGNERIAIQAGEKSWQAQVEDFYWRLFSRPPTAEEMVKVKEAFLRIYGAQQSTIHAWIGVLYGLLASAEYWNA